MIIRRVTLSDFGIYGGSDWSFDLVPQPEDGFNRPIILFKGKNGVGKTTLTEAIRLCLHGSLALGSRVSQVEYEAHLARRIHIASDPKHQSTSAKISLVLDYVTVGRKHTYQIDRSWDRINNKIKEDLEILEDNQPLSDLSTLQQKEGFLRELVPPNIAEIFFFDGERLQMLADDNTHHNLLADTLKTLLGLQLVEQLQKDLDIYLVRQEISSELKALQKQLEALTGQHSTLDYELATLQVEQQANRTAIHKIQHQINHQEQKIANQGSWFAERLEDLKATQQRLITEIELQRKQAQELANGLLPFAVAPHMVGLVAQRLEQESAYEQALTRQQTVATIYGQIETEMKQSDYLAELGIDLDLEQQARLLAKIKASMAQSTPSPQLAPHDIILHVSEQERQTLFRWIEQALDETPRQFCQTISRLNALEDELARVNHELTLVPNDETLKPLVETLQIYHQELGALSQIEKNLDEQRERLTYQLEQAAYRVRAIRQQIAEQHQRNQRIQLASKAHLVLEDYAQALKHEKVALLEQALTRCFNELSRKADLIEGIRVDPDTFKMTLFRKQQPFERKQLSAGEKQILAIAAMWALREVSGRPMPVILDTPLGRLDSDHRRRMLEDYFPRASHQVILLATDMEIDAAAEAKLKPFIAHSYDLTSRTSPRSLHYPRKKGQGTQLTLIKEEAFTDEAE